MQRMKQWAKAAVIVTGLTSVASPALASNQGFPWENTIDQIMLSLSGGTMIAIATIAVMVCGLALAFGNFEGGARRIIQILLGISVAFGAASVVGTFFTATGALY
jgi:type IV secretion system protein TrbC